MTLLRVLRGKVRPNDYPDGGSIADALVEGGVISLAAMQSLREKSVVTGESVACLAVQNKVVSEADLLVFLGEHYRAPTLDLRGHSLDPDVARMLPARFSLSNLVLPVNHIADQKVIVVGMANPTDVATIDSVRFGTGLSVEVVVVTECALRDTLREHHGEPGSPTVLDYDRMLANVTLAREELAEVITAMVQTVEGTNDELVGVFMKHYTEVTGQEATLQSVLDRPVDTTKIAHPEQALLNCLWLIYIGGPPGSRDAALDRLAADLGVTSKRLDELDLMVRIKIFSAMVEQVQATSPTPAAEAILEHLRRELDLDEESAARAADAAKLPG